MEYRITKQQCADGIRGVCSRCGGEIVPIETVDNSNNPTFWSGCEKCSCFDSGVDPVVYETAKRMVGAGYRPSKHYWAEPGDSAEMSSYKNREQIGAACDVVQEVLTTHRSVIRRTTLMADLRSLVISWSAGNKHVSTTAALADRVYAACAGELEKVISRYTD